MSRDYDLFEKIEKGLGEMVTIDVESILDNDIVRINSEEELFGMTAVKPKPKKKRWTKSFAGVAVAASLLIGCFGVFGGAEIQGQLIVDVNPSVALDIGRDYKVVGVEALNSDGEAIVKAMDQQKGEVGEVLTELSDVLDSRGYIDDDDSGILISYCNRDTKADNAQKREALKEETKRFIGEYFEADEAKKTTVFYQEFQRNDEDRKGAKENNISEGKYHFISQLNTRVAEKFDSAESMKDIVKQLKENQISVGMVDVYNSQFFKGDGEFCIREDVIKSESDSKPEGTAVKEKTDVAEEGAEITAEPVYIPAEWDSTETNNQGSNNDHQNNGHQQNPNNGQSEKNDNKKEDEIILGAKDDDIEEIGATDEIIDDADNIQDDNDDIEDDQGEEDDCLGDDSNVQDEDFN